MKIIFIIFSVVMTACTNHVKSDHHANKIAVEHENSAKEVQLNNGRKWKTDTNTKRNVAAILTIVKDSSYIYESNRMDLLRKIQGKIDTLILQCRLKGDAHDALHVWLEKVLRDVKELREDKEYMRAHAALKKDVERFYEFFE